jgi:hypothetical protein
VSVIDSQLKPRSVLRVDVEHPTDDPNEGEEQSPATAVRELDIVVRRRKVEWWRSQAPMHEAMSSRI